MVDKENTFVCALYESLGRGSVLEADQAGCDSDSKETDVIQGKMFECAQIATSGETLFVEKHYRLDAIAKSLHVYDANAVDLEEEIYLTKRVKKVIKSLKNNLGDDERTKMLTDGYIVSS